MDKSVLGLSESEVRASRERHGSNLLEVKKGISFFARLKSNLSDPIIKILIAAFFITLLFSGGRGAYFEAIGIGASVLISVLVSTLSEYGSEKAFRRMQNEAMLQTCEVMRSGKRIFIPVSELVLGDTLILSAGDTVGADGILVSGAISVDMSALNGESREKHFAYAEGKEITVYRGSAVTAGSGILRVTSVGGETYYGKIASELQSGNGESPLKGKLSALARTLSRFGYFCAVCVAFSYLLNVFFLSGDFVFSAKGVARELLAAITLGVSVVVVAVPEGLPMMITVVLSSNMIRMQRENIRVRRPVGIETAGSVDLLFTDKTGTLTYGKPQVYSFIDGTLSRSHRSADLCEPFRFLMGVCAFLCTESRRESLFGSGKGRAVGGNSAERAILDEYLKHGNEPRGVKCRAFLPFDSRTKLSCASLELDSETEAKFPFGSGFSLIKGAPELLLKHCSHYYSTSGKREKIKREALEKELAELSAKGIRTLAVMTSTASSETVEAAAKTLTSGKTPDTCAIFENGTFLCFIAVKDAVRQECRSVIGRLRGAGIQTVMVTGDSLATASAIASESGITDGKDSELLIESEELRNMSDEELSASLPRLRLVARALPDDKSRLVRVAKSCGRICAMTGDGLNDAPALKAADVGFAMGSGAEVAKEASDIILTDSNISGIEKAVLYGRTVFRSIRKFIVFQLIMNLSAVGISIIGPFIGMENPVTVMQMLWINLIMDTLAAIAFAGEAPLMRYMKSPPVPKDAPVLSGDMITRIFCLGVYNVTVCLYYCLSPKSDLLFGGRESIYFYSGFFALFVFCGIFGAFCARSGRANILSGLFQNPVFVVIIAAVFCSQVAMIYFGGEVLRCAPLTFSQLRFVILPALTVIPAAMLLEMLLRIRLPVKKT